MDRIIFLFILWGCLIANVRSVEAADNAVILLYHHVSEKTPASTSVSPGTFRSHMQYLSDNFQVLPLAEIISALKAKKSLPDRAIAITFDDGYLDIYDNGHPILREFKLPYTVFINPALVGEVNYHLSWQQMKTMTEQGASFANHYLRHEHLLARQGDEAESAWLKRVGNEVQQAEQLLQKNLGLSHKYFAYPYGEFSSALQQHISDLGFIGFAQYSGAVASFSDFSALPRFPAAGVEADFALLKIKMHSLAMPVTDASPSDPVMNEAQMPFTFSFEVNDKDIDNGRITCFFKGQPQSIEVAGKKILAEFNMFLPYGRSRLNCTVPSIAQPSRYYWYSKPFFVANQQGQWPD
ncbi:MAG: peptidoglycan/xylan/chitin deacetylase (PgdA/CDA1 family) [Paraglaciecola sp.]|jgi:peptidoglycan/xylan/chitin deacetylase (PgdA/CDA1 family)